MAQANERTILVTGATGNQGGAVANALLAVGWTVRGLTRNPRSETAEALLGRGAEIVEGDLEHPATLEAAMEGVHGVYSVQAPGAQGPETEVQWGKNVADAAKKAGVAHLVYSSVAGADRLAYPGAHSKHDIEEYIQSTGVPFTFIRPVSFMENTLRLKRAIFRGRITRQLKPTTREEIIAVRDIGAFVAAAFDRPKEFQGEGVNIAGDNPTMEEAVAAISRRVGKPVEYVQMAREEVEARIPAGLVALMDWVEREGYGVDIPALRERWGVPLTSFEEWLNTTDWSEEA